MNTATRNTCAHVSPIYGLHHSISRNRRPTESVQLPPFTRKGLTAHRTLESEMNTLFLDKRSYDTTRGMLNRGYHSHEKETSPTGAVVNEVWATPTTVPQTTRSATVNVAFYVSGTSPLGKEYSVRTESKNALGEPLSPTLAFNLEHQVQPIWSKKHELIFSNNKGARSRTKQ